MLNHYFILCRWALFTKEHYALAYYKNKWISLCFLKDPWKSIGALLLFCCGGVHLKMQIRADQSEALKPEPCQPIRSSKTWATLSAVIPSYTKPPITSFFSHWSSFLYNLFVVTQLCELIVFSYVDRIKYPYNHVILTSLGFLWQMNLIIFIF